MDDNKPQFTEKPRALIIDDEPAILTLMMQILQSKGFHVVAANNPEDGMLLLGMGEYKLIVTDLKMPGMINEPLPGLQIAELARQLHEITTIIVFSGDLGTEGVTERLASIADIKTMPKPFDFATFTTLIAESLLVQ